MPKTGEFWYAMLQSDDSPQGYARLAILDREGGGFDVDWELRLAFVGGSYEEQRSSSFDAKHRLVAVGYASGKQKFAAERKGDEMVVTTPEKLPPVKVKQDAIAGMGFVLAATMPLEEGARIERTDHNEAQGLAAEGTVVFDVVGKETLEVDGQQIETFKVVMTRQSGNELPLWIDAERRIVRADWGPGTRMEIRAEPTRDLFKPEPPAFVEVEGKDKSRLVVSGDFAGFTVEEMFRHWLEPEKLKAWWPQEAQVEAKVGGKYHMIWNQPEWRMRGEIRALEENSRLSFAWKWDHLPDLPELEVTVEFEPIEGGTRLRITQGPYEHSERDLKERAGHLDGWRFFGAKLRVLARGG